VLDLSLRSSRSSHFKDCGRGIQVKGRPRNVIPRLETFPLRNLAVINKASSCSAESSLVCFRITPSDQLWRTRLGIVGRHYRARPRYRVARMTASSLRMTDCSSIPSSPPVAFGPICDCFKSKAAHDAGSSLSTPGPLNAQLLSRLSVYQPGTREKALTAT
jgi:hypothetical protein